MLRDGVVKKTPPIAKHFHLIAVDPNLGEKN